MREGPTFVEETIALTEQFDEDEHEDTRLPSQHLERDTPLMLCLKRHHELSQQIVDVRDEIVASGRGLGDDDMRY